MGQKTMHQTAKTVDEKFNLFENSYLLVVPAGGLRSGYDVVAAFNGNKIQNFDDLDAAIEHAKDYTFYQDMDGVIAYHEPEMKDESESG